MSENKAPQTDREALKQEIIALTDQQAEYVLALLQQLSPAQFDEILGQLCAKNVRQKDEQQ